MPCSSASILAKKIPKRFAALLAAFLVLGSFGNGPLLCSQEADLQIQFPSGQTVDIPPAALNATASPEDKRRVLEEIAGKIGWTRFSSSSLNAPVRITIEEIQNGQAERVGYFVKSAYILNATREQLENRDLLESSFGKPKAPDDPDRKLDQLAMKELNAEELQVEASDRSFLWIELPLLKKILIRAVLAAEKEQDEAQFALKWKVDSQFTAGTQNSTKANAEYHNQWSPLAANELGRVVEGETNPYQGMAGTMHITRTDQEPDQWLVESFLVLHEPQDWFGEGQYLRSKLPAALQESAKTFRRKLR